MKLKLNDRLLKSAYRHLVTDVCTCSHSLCVRATASQPLWGGPRQGVQLRETALESVQAHYANWMMGCIRVMRNEL